MLIDLHNHTTPRSACSVMTPDDLVDFARRAGLDALCITEHDRIWKADELRELSEKHDFPLLRGKVDLRFYLVERHVRGPLSRIERVYLIKWTGAAEMGSPGRAAGCDNLADYTIGHVPLVPGPPPHPLRSG